MAAAAKDDLLEKVEEYLLEDAQFSEDFEKFAADNCGIFEDNDENKLEYTTVYNKFTDLFNARVEEFIKKSGATLEEFVKRCDEAEDDNFAVQLILSITSFDAFKQLMLEEKAKGKYNVQ